MNPIRDEPPAGYDWNQEVLRLVKGFLYRDDGGKASLEKRKYWFVWIGRKWFPVGIARQVSPVIRDELKYENVCSHRPDEYVLTICLFAHDCPDEVRIQMTEEARKSFYMQLEPWLSIYKQPCFGFRQVPPWLSYICSGNHDCYDEGRAEPCGGCRAHQMRGERGRRRSMMDAATYARDILGL